MNNYRPTVQAESRNEAPAKLGRSMHRNSLRSCKMVVTLGIREFASNDRHVFLEVIVRSWTNSHRNKVELVNRFCMVGPRQAVYMVTAVLVHLAYLVSYYLRWQLYSAVPQFPVFWPSEMTSATFCESSPTVQSRVQSRVQSTEYRRPTHSTFLSQLAMIKICCRTYFLAAAWDKRMCLLFRFLRYPTNREVC